MPLHALDNLSNLTNPSSARAAIEAVSGDGLGITDPAAFRENLQLAGHASGRPFAGLKQVLNANRSCGLAIVGDSTGVGNTRWPRLFTEYIAAQFPNYTVRRESWSGTAWTNDYTRAGGAGERGWRFPTSGPRFPVSLSSQDFGISQTNDVAIEVKIKVEDFAGMGTFLVSCWNNTSAAGASNADRQWAVSINTAKIPFLSWYNDAVGFNQNYCSFALPYNNGDTFWLRVELDSDNGAAGHTIIFKYRTLDTDAWTILDTNTVAGTSSLNNPANGNIRTLMLFDVNGGTTLYRLNSFDQLDPTVGPMPMAPVDHFDLGSVTNTAEIVGSPEFVVRDQSVSGWGVNQFYNTSHASYIPWNKSFFRTDEGIRAAIVNLSHNMGAEILYSDPGNFAAGCKGILDEMQLRFPLARRVFVAQNPQTFSPTVPNDRHALRIGRMIDQAVSENSALINAFQAFLDDGRDIDDLVVPTPDNIHPTAAGSEMWADVFIDAFESNR
jgi:hypothetical protein